MTEPTRLDDSHEFFAGVRWSRNILVEILNNYRTAVTPAQRDALRVAIVALHHVEDGHGDPAAALAEFNKQWAAGSSPASPKGPPK